MLWYSSKTLTYISKHRKLIRTHIISDFDLTEKYDGFATGQKT
jgi:hypothetical protein